MTINVLGTDYSIKTCSETEDSRIKDCDGICDETVKEIVVQDYTEKADLPDSKKNLALQSRKVLRHEIVHAFAFESGLAENSSWAMDEEIVDWIAIQGPKIYNAWKEVGAV